MSRFALPQKLAIAWKKHPDWQILLSISGIFFGVVLLFSLHRHFTFYTSYDHGLFNQVFWNNLHGNWFQSSLTGANSVAVLEDGKLPPVNFLHLGHHFVLAFLLWLPLYALFPSPVTLIVLQVGLMTVAGYVLYALARHYLPPAIALLIAAAYYSASAVIGPTFANFYEHCQIPLFAFGLLLALEKRWWWTFWLCTALLLLVREDAGFISFAIGLYLLLSRRHPWVGAALCLVSFGYVTLITNWVIPQFSDDSSRLYLSVRFRQFVQGQSNPSTLQLLWGILTHPRELLESLLLPLDVKLFYLFRQWLPLMLVPAVSPAAWVLTSVPLATLFLQEGMSATMISIRYAIALVPGVFYGGILWWSHHAHQFRPRLRRIWIACISLSLIFALTANPNRVFSFVIPDSVKPLVYVPLPRAWEHAAAIQSLIRQVPPDASVSATTFIIPHLSSRREIIRLPAIQLLGDRGQVMEMEYLIADVWTLQQYQAAFKNDRKRLQVLVPFLDQVIATGTYGLLKYRDGVLLLQRGKPSNSTALADWQTLRQAVAPLLP